jgi:hypothetical protein
LVAATLIDVVVADDDIIIVFVVFADPNAVFNALVFGFPN